MSDDLPKWVTWVAVAPLAIIGCIAVLGMLVGMWEALGWRAFIIIPGMVFWLGCLALVFDEANKRG